MSSIARNLFRPVAPVVLACAFTSVHAQDKPSDYPIRPIRIIVGVAPGAGNDAITRAAAQLLSDRWGQTVVVDNRSGGGTVIAAELGAQAAPDGYTILSATNSIMLVGSMKRVAFDIRKALDPIVIMTTQPYILVINPLQDHEQLQPLRAGRNAASDHPGNQPRDHRGHELTADGAKARRRRQRAGRAHDAG